MRSVKIAFGGGKSNVKLYFMNGLPTETMDDIAGIAELSGKVIGTYYSLPKEERPKGGVGVTISVACFVPKPHTPFQWEKQDSYDMLVKKQEHLKNCITDRRIRYTYHDARVSRVEAVLARGDRRVGAALALACERGFMFDAWDEFFSYEKWEEVFRDAGVDMDFYTTRGYAEDEVLPWDIIDIGVTKQFLLRERRLAYEAKTTPSCQEKCSGCGANKLGGKNRWCK